MSLAPLPGNALIEMNLAIIMVIIDRLLGGTGVAVPAPRELTPIEMSVVRSVVRMALNELQSAWESTMPGLQFEWNHTISILNSCALQHPESSRASVTFDWRIGETAGVINLCYPFPVIAGVAKVSTESAAARVVKEPTEGKRK